MAHAAPDAGPRGPIGSRWLIVGDALLGLFAGSVLGLTVGGLVGQAREPAACVQPNPPILTCGWKTAAAVVVGVSVGASLGLLGGATVGAYRSHRRRLGIALSVVIAIVLCVLLVLLVIWTLSDPPGTT
jgi:hypothetical protein